MVGIRHSSVGMGACVCVLHDNGYMDGGISLLDSNGCAASICGAWRLVAVGLWLVPRRV